jgi:hypothetical protein
MLVPFFDVLPGARAATARRKKRESRKEREQNDEADKRNDAGLNNCFSQDKTGEVTLTTDFNPEISANAEGRRLKAHLGIRKKTACLKGML